MSFWREACQPLRRIASRATAGSERSYYVCQQSKRYMSNGNLKSTQQRLLSTPAGIAVREVHAPRVCSWHSVKQQARRQFSLTAGAQHGHITPPKPGEEINVSFIDKDGQKYDFQVAEGDNLLDIAQANDLEMEGACGGSCACSTCHVIVEDPDMYDKMEEPSDDENDMLDLAFGLTETSRLGCQVVMNKDLDGLVVKLPAMTRNMQASDFTEKKK